MQDPRVEKCLKAKRESKSIEFKEEFVPTDPRQSLEVLKDIVAIANSGGGALAIGINNQGAVSGADVKAALEHDQAKYGDLIRKYTLQNYNDFEVVEAQKDGHTIAIFLINPPDYPLVFEKPGTYAVEGGKHQQTAFGQGTVFFRHGAKSETGTTDDLRKFMQARIREMQEQLMKGLRKVSEAPRGSELQVVPTGTDGQSIAGSVAVRLTKDAGAQGVIAIDKGKLCPYRRKEVVALLKARLPEDFYFSTHDLQAINRVYNVGEKEEFAWQPDHSSMQYSDAYVEWLFENMTKDKDFLTYARDKFYQITHPA